MANIKVNNIQVNGIQLFDDSESFMDELNNDELADVYGGLRSSGGPVTVTGGSCAQSACCVTAKLAAVV